MTDLRALLEATKDKDYNKAIAAEMELAKPLRRCADELVAVVEAARETFPEQRGGCFTYRVDGAYKLLDALTALDARLAEENK